MLDVASTIESALRRMHQALPLASPPGARRLFLAFSGGGDSAALLNVVATSELPNDFEVIVAHVNHKLANEADKWEAHCREVAKACDFKFKSHRVPGQALAGQNVEQWAREGRYRWFAKILSQGDFLVTAHHMNDQMETFMLNLMRAAGPQGLGAMRDHRKLGDGYLVRPMLMMTSEDVNAYVKERDLSVLSDPMNDASEFDRVYLREHVIPMLTRRWPQAGKQIATAAGIQQSLAKKLDDNAREILSEAAAAKSNEINLAVLEPHDGETRACVLRLWCRELGLGLPERRHLAEIEKSVFSAETINTSLNISWKNVELRYFDGKLLLRKREELIDSTMRYQWDLQTQLILPHGVVSVRESFNGGLDMGAIRSATRIEVGYYRRQGERCHPANRSHGQSLKKLFQQWQVPLWERDRLPIIWIDGNIAAIVSQCIDRGYAAVAGDSGVLPEFRRHNW
ncbi:MAG: tRNA lysidine(34) synthetase TilS [Pseudomonadota bacterium]